MLTIKNTYKIKCLEIDRGGWYIWDIDTITHAGIEDNSLYHYYRITLNNPNDKRTENVFLNRIPDERGGYELSILVGGMVYKEIVHKDNIMHIPTLLIFIKLLMIDSLSNKKRV